MAKKADTWMPLYVDAYKRDTEHLTTEQHGAYFLLLMRCWQNEGYLPDDDDDLCAITRMDRSSYRKSSAKLRAFFKSTVDGRLMHGRVIAEHQKAQELSQKRKEIGALGGKSKKQTRTTSEPIGIAKPKQTSLQNGTPIPVLSELPLPSEVIGGGGSASAPKPDPTDWPDDVTECRSSLMAIAGPGMGDPNKHPGLILTASEISRWKAGGCSWAEDVIPAVMAITARATNGQIQNWTYFTPAIIRRRDARLTPLPEPQLQQVNHERSDRSFAGATSNRGMSGAESFLAGAALTLDRIAASSGSREGYFDEGRPSGAEGVSLRSVTPDGPVSARTHRDAPFPADAALSSDAEHA